MPEAAPLLETDRLSCSHAGQPAVVSLSLALRPGELGCLVRSLAQGPLSGWQCVVWEVLLCWAAGWSAC